ncbi:hypothetical protein [Pengzhenrongella sicca]|uniref:Apea-like HEPN domain-containing protein n=1 Tax=Pengzhenrongella sicca TaxID=2819238 RepID=A0A8A4ZDH8_9MICO|nr:hypothetical protein [Pengzhenrongella sicca]QTE28537.1 hypothetical protein J4E96_14335 [Pengzhenrongella sicca]
MGTDAWRNWSAYNVQASESENFQDEAHSDRRFTGGPLRLGPTVLHVVIRESESMGPAVLMHTGIHAHLMPELIVEGKLAPADSSAYHGGTMSDEIAALVSLELGVRLRVAGTRQLSGIRTRDLPAPIYLEVQPLARPGRADHEVLPRVMHRTASLDDLRRLKDFSQLESAAAVELVRAAREYSAAIWWANENPDQGWLHLVSAIEIAATHRQTESAPAVDLLREHWPEMWKALEGADDDVRAKAANELVQQMRATRRFVGFLTELAPEPPSPRPEWDEFDWTAMRSHARIIYAHRSKALHAGKPFPMPMRETPHVDAAGALQEAPWGLTSGGPGAIWERRETPMLLSTFEYIVRSTLLRWWDELAPTTQAEGADVPRTG